MAGIPCLAKRKLFGPPVGRVLEGCLRAYGSAIDGHSCDCVDSHGVESVYFAAFFDSSGYDQLLGGACSEDGGYVDGEALHGAFGVDVGVEEGGTVVFEPGDGFFRSEVDGVFPAFDGDFAAFGVDAEDQGFFP